MMLIRCTKKLRKEMGLEPSGLREENPQHSLLGPWHANLIYIERKKCVLFVNDKTLFNFITPGVSRAQIRDLSVLFVDNLQRVIDQEGFPKSIRNDMLSEYGEIGYAATNNKSVLASMNDLAYHYKSQIWRKGGFRGCSLPGIICLQNRMPMGALGYAFPINLLRAIYELDPDNSGIGLFG